jgi:hypothetical protein
MPLLNVTLAFASQLRRTMENLRIAKYRYPSLYVINAYLEIAAQSELILT